MSKRLRNASIRCHSGPSPGDQRVDPRDQRVEGVQLGQFRSDSEQPLGLVLERQGLALHHRQAGLRGDKLRVEECRAAGVEAVFLDFGLGDPFAQRRNPLDQPRQVVRRRRGFGLRLDLGRAVVGVDVAFLLLADRQLQQQVVARDRVEVGSGVGGSAAGGEGESGERRDEHADHVRGIGLRARSVNERMTARRGKPWPQPRNRETSR